MSQLRSVTCHMGSHSVTCYPTQVNAPRLHPSQSGRYSIYLPRRDRRLSWVVRRLYRSILYCPVGCQSTLLIPTLSCHCQRARCCSHRASKSLSGPWHTVQKSAHISTPFFSGAGHDYVRHANLGPDSSGTRLRRQLEHCSIPSQKVACTWLKWSFVIYSCSTYLWLQHPL